MRLPDIEVLILWVFVLAGVALALFLFSNPQILAAIISAAALIFGGILTHYFTQIREQGITQQRRMQENYLELLDIIDVIIRKPDAPNDDFSKIHLQSWVVGSPRVIQFTSDLLEQRDPLERKATLEKLLKEMRKDLGLSRTTKKLGPIFPTIKQSGLDEASRPAEAPPPTPPVRRRRFLPW